MKSAGEFSLMQNAFGVLTPSMRAFVPDVTIAQLACALFSVDNMLLAPGISTALAPNSSGIRPSICETSRKHQSGLPEEHPTETCTPKSPSLALIFSRYQWSGGHARSAEELQHQNSSLCQVYNRDQSCFINQHRSMNRLANTGNLANKSKSKRASSLPTGASASQ